MLDVSWIRYSGINWIDHLSPNSNCTPAETVPLITKELNPVVEKEPEINIPEGIGDLVNFINETGGSLEDYVKLNKDYSKLDDVNVLKEYYSTTKPHLNNDEINFLVDEFIPSEPFIK